jgi:hypothetical protein
VKYCTYPVKIVDKTIMEADLDRDGKISFEEFTKMVENTDVSTNMTLGMKVSTTLLPITNIFSWRYFLIPWIPSSQHKAAFRCNNCPILFLCDHDVHADNC